MTEFRATYRLQLGPGFGFAEALGVTDYLAELGVSHLYLSPIWQARAGSTHGYDVVDPTRVSDDLGGEEGFAALARCGLGIVLDLVPNHMSTDEANPFWSDPLLRARTFDIESSTGRHRRFFDIDELAGVKIEEPQIFEVTHRKALELLAAGLVDGLRIDHLDGLAEPARYLGELAQRGVAHVWIEKILGTGEELRDWPIEGTTGYDFLNEVTALFVEPESEILLSELAKEPRSFAEVAHEAKLEQVRTTFIPELRWLRSILDLPEIDRGLASLPVYRTYVDPYARRLEQADRDALAHLPDPLRSVLTLDNPAPPEFVVRFQQTSGAVMAKGVEDTALYRYVRLLALNEVGGDPARFGLSSAAFHLANQARLRRFPKGLLTSQTHDTKRSGDVRARLAALSQIAPEWADAVHDWHRQNRQAVSGATPDWSEELFIYQTLIGTWPIEPQRLADYLQKAWREAKRHTSWAEPNEKWEAGIFDFCRQLLQDRRFLDSFEPLAARVRLKGERLSLVEVALRCSSPGVPDIYWGDERWNFSLVDPDNRRSVDWEQSRAMLEELRSGGVLSRTNAKLFVLTSMLQLRKRRSASFAGDYLPLKCPPGSCGFQRGADVVVAVALRDRPVEVELPPGNWTNIFEPLSAVYENCAVAVYERT